MFDYEAKFIKNYDGDTITFLLDLGLTTYNKATVRLYGVNTPEIRGGSTETKGFAKVAKKYVFDALSSAAYIRVLTIKDKKEKYGRYLGRVIYSIKEFSINDFNPSFTLNVNELRETKFDDLLKLRGFRELSNALLTDCIGTVPFLI